MSTSMGEGGGSVWGVGGGGEHTQNPGCKVFAWLNSVSRMTSLLQTGRATKKRP